MREVAGYDDDKAQRVIEWPLREAVMAYDARLKIRAAEDYRHSCLLWAASTAFVSERPPPPELPAILRD